MAFTTAAPCDGPQVVLTAKEAGAERVTTVPGTADGDQVSVTTPWAALLPDTTACGLARAVTLTATLSCADGAPRPVAEERTLEVDGQLEAPFAALGAPTHLFARRPFSDDPGLVVWAAAGDTLVGAQVGGAPTVISGFGADDGVHLRVRGALYDFLAVSCAADCGQAVVNDGPNVQVVPSDWVLAVPVGARRAADVAVARFAVPAGIVDLAFQDGTVRVLSQVGGDVVLSSFDEAPDWPTDAPLLARSDVIPGSTAGLFHGSESWEPVALSVLADGTSWTGWNTATNTEIPVPYPSTGGGCGGTGGTSPSPSPSGGTPVSTGDSPGVAQPRPSGCVLSNHINIHFPSRAAGSVEAQVGDDTFGLPFRPDLPDEPAVTMWSTLPDRLLVAIGDETGASVAVLRFDNGTATWLDLPALADPRFSVSPGGDRFVVAAGGGVHLFDRDGNWLLGADAVPARCAAEAQLVDAHTLVLASPRGAVSWSLP